jgi:hypothetical protein
MNKWARIALLLAATATTSLFLIRVKGGVLADPALRPGRFVSISLPGLEIGARERVIGFQVNVTSGRIAQLGDMPIGWNIAVDNDPSWNTSVDASIHVAAASLDTSFFKDFAVIEKEDLADSPFELSGKVVVSADFSHSRTIQVAMKDFVIREDVQFLKSHPSK